VQAPVDEDETVVMVRLTAPAPGDPRTPAFELLGNVLSGGRGARLHRAMDIEPALRVNDLGAGLTYVGGQAYFDVSAYVPEGTDPHAVATRITGELERLAAEEVADAELASARVAFRADEASLREKIHYYGMMRSDKILNWPVSALNEQLERHRRVTPTTLRETVAAWLEEPDVLVALVGPDLEAQDEATTPEALGFVTPGVPLPGSDPALVVDAREAPPRAESASPPRMVTLDSGLRVVVSSDPVSNVLAMHLMALGRSFREPEGLAGIASFTHRLLTRGAGEWDAATLGSRLAAIGASVKTHDNANIPYDDYYSSPQFSYVRFEALDDYYDEAFSLMGTMVTRPRFDETEIDRVREELRQIASSDAESPVARARVAYRRVIYGADSPAARPITGTPESLDRIDRAALEVFHRSYFAPSNLVLAVVTGLPEEVVIDRIERYFRFDETANASLAWSAEDALPTVTAEPEVVEETLGAPQSDVLVGYVFDFAPEDGPALDVANLLLSDRMAFHLRERLGLAYSIGSSFSAWGHRGILTAAMGTRPENIEIALAGLAEQIDSLAVVDFDETTLETAVNARVGRMRMRRITRMGQAFYLCMDVLHGEPLMSHDRQLVAMRDVGPKRLSQVAAMYLDSDRANRVIVR
jgi:predicted Zn-dependent peptidase